MFFLQLMSDCITADSLVKKFNEKLEILKLNIKYFSKICFSIPTFGGMIRMMKKPKLKDIAEAAGVSVTTVSLVLSGKGKISHGVMKRIKESAESLGYVHKTRNPSSRLKSFKYVAILHYETTSYLWNFSRPFITYLEELLINKGYFLLSFTCFPAENERKTQEIIASGAGAVFAVHYVNEQLFDELEHAGIPVIILNNSNFQKQYFSVLVDDIQGAYEGTSYGRPGA